MGGLNILQVMRAPVGGLFRHVADLSRELAARGHNVGIVADSLSADAMTEQRLADLAGHARLGIHRLPIPRLLGAADLTTPIKIARLSRALDVSILHGHGAKGGFGARVARLANHRVRAFYTPHGGALHFDASTPSGAIFMTIERMLLRATDTLIFESAHAQAMFGEKVSRPRCKQSVVHNGLNGDEFTAITPSPEAADFVFVGELRNLKGIDMLVDALAPLRRKDGTPATLVMAGDGPDAGALRSRIARLGLETRVTLAGAQPARKMFPLGRCLVMPSRAESLPYVVLEAGAARLPMIATNVGGIPEIYGSLANRLIPAGDVGALSARMAQAIDQPGAFVSDAGALQDRIRQHFSIQTMTDSIEALYRAAS